MYQRILRRAFLPCALAALAVCALGCGSDDPTPAASAAKPIGMPVRSYVEQVAGLGQSIDDARSAYFHADHTRAAIKRGAADVQAAYADAASQLATIDPPRVAADLHKQLTATWIKRAGQLEKAVATKPLDTGRIDDVMAATDRDVSSAELYSLPQ